MRPPETSLALQKGVAAHRRGKIDIAEHAYRSVLAQEPENAVANHNLGLIVLDRGDPLSAFNSILRALKALPDNTDFVSSLIEAARAANWPKEVLQHIAGQTEPANPSSLRLYSALAEGLAKQQTSPEEALRQLSPALQLTEKEAKNWHNLAFHLLQLNCPQAASSAIEKALPAREKSPPETPAQYLASLNLKAAILRALKKDKEATECLQQAVAMDPSLAQSWHNLAALYQDQGDFQAADKAIRQALGINPNYPAALAAEGSIALARHEFQRAQSSCETALRLSPDLPDAHWNLGLACLSQGDFQRGWAEYEWRRRLPGYAPLAHFFRIAGIPLWQGEPLSGKTLLLHAEQGHGDTLQFIRLAEPLAQQGARIIARVQPSLVRLLSRCPFLHSVHPGDAPIPLADFCLSIMSLPHRLGLTIGTIPAKIPYLHPAPEDIAAWKEHLAAWPTPRVGLAWAGDPRPESPESNRIDQRRSLSFSLLHPILDLPGFTFVSLQKGDAAHQLQPRANLLDRTAALHDFADTAALIANLDIVVSVDTAVAHLAAALNVPTLLLSRFDACWRWLGNRPTSPWYPAITLFGQTRAGEWNDVVLAVADELNKRHAFCYKPTTDQGGQHVQ